LLAKSYTNKPAQVTIIVKFLFLIFEDRAAKTKSNSDKEAGETTEISSVVKITS